MTDKFEGFSMSQLAERADLHMQLTGIQSKYEAVVAELEQVSTEGERLKLALSTAMESVTNALHVLRVETARSNLLAVENAQLRTAIEFATAPDMWVEQHNGMLDYRYSEWYVDVLNTALETPVTEDAIVESLLSKWVAGNIPPEFKKYYVRYVTDVGPQFCVAEWYEYDPCVPSDRRIRIWLPDHARSIHGLANVTHYHELPVFNLLTPACSFVGDKS